MWVLLVFCCLLCDSWCALSVLLLLVVRFLGVCVDCSLLLFVMCLLVGMCVKCLLLLLCVVCFLVCEY